MESRISVSACSYGEDHVLLHLTMPVDASRCYWVPGSYQHLTISRTTRRGLTTPNASEEVAMQHSSAIVQRLLMQVEHLESAVRSSCF
jgi:hypothetical protein